MADNDGRSMSDILRAAAGKDTRSRKEIEAEHAARVEEERTAASYAPRTGDEAVSRPGESSGDPARRDMNTLLKQAAGRKTSTHTGQPDGAIAKARNLDEFDSGRNHGRTEVHDSNEFTISADGEESR